MTHNWHSLTPTQTASELASDLENGLSSAEAQARLARYGANKLPEPKATSPWRIFFEQFKSVMTILLVAAAGIAFVLGDELEAVSILAVLLLNALLGFVNDYRAEKSVQALKALTVPLAKAIRDGASREIPAADLAPGDVILFEAGDRIPADARLNESAMTCESLPAEKDSQTALPVEAPPAERATMVYMGTACSTRNNIRRAP